MTGKHNEKIWKEFLNLRKLIAQKPNDIKLLKEELKNNYYQQRINTLSDVRRHMSETFEHNFFCRETVRFFGHHKYYFSKKELTVSCVFSDRIVVYEIVFSNGNLELSRI